MGVKTLVCLSGTLCDKALWQSQAEILSPVYDCVFPSIHTHNHIADVVASMVESLPETFAVVGMSAGAVVAFEMMRQVPDRLEKVCIVAGNPNGVTPTMAQRLDEQVVTIRALGIRDYFERFLLPYTLSPCTMGDVSIREQIIAMAERIGIDVFVKQIQMLKTRGEALTPLAHFTGDVLAVCGADDPLCTPAMHNTIADIAPRGRTIVLPKTGHYVNFENQQGLNKALLNFF